VYCWDAFSVVNVLVEREVLKGFIIYTTWLGQCSISPPWHRLGQNERSRGKVMWDTCEAHALFAFASVRFPWAFFQLFCVSLPRTVRARDKVGALRHPRRSRVWVLRVFGAVWDKFNTQPGSVRTLSWPGLSPSPPPVALGPSSPPPLYQRRCTNTTAPLAMDPPQTSSSANDIFSLSDQTLADRLQFIEEVRIALSRSNRHRH